MSGGPRVLIRRLDPTLPLPSYALAGDAGMDLRSAVDVVLAPGERCRIPTGIAVAIPDGHAGFVQPRSGLAARTGLGFVNSPGLIDSGYRGEIQVVAINLDRQDPIDIRRGDKIAQLVILPVPQVALAEVEELPASDRGAGGFGFESRRPLQVTPQVRGLTPRLSSEDGDGIRKGRAATHLAEPGTPGRTQAGARAM
ncbi:MAG: dUTP diphosphatase [Actinobacteria bacterium]|nr:MAG: dUTP diphosphatase [Actinomycetota bacterium]